MERRKFLTVVGAASVGLAGCTGPGAEEPTETETQAMDGGGTPTGTATPADGATPTEGAATPTEGTATPTEGTATDGTPTGGTATGTVTNEIRMVTDGDEYYFDPIGLFVEGGEEVTWVLDSGAHSSTAYHESLDAASVTRIPEAAEPWDSGILTEVGATFEHAFDVQGTYDYFCIPHKQLGMVGRLVVGEPGGVDGDPPDGDVPSPQAIVEQGAISYDEFTG